MTQARKGATIQTIDDVLARCDVDEITGCWRWTMAMSRGSHGTPIPVAQVWVDDKRRMVTIMRLVKAFTSGDLGWVRPGRSGMRVWRTCSNAVCVCPEHLTSGSRSAMYAWQRKHLYPKVDRLVYRLRNRQGSKRALTEQQIDEIRTSHKTGGQLAEEMSVSRKVVSRVRCGAYLPTVVGASVFTWRPE